MRSRGSDVWTSVCLVAPAALDHDIPCPRETHPGLVRADVGVGDIVHRLGQSQRARKALMRRAANFRVNRMAVSATVLRVASEKHPSEQLSGLRLLASCMWIAWLTHYNNTDGLEFTSVSLVRAQLCGHETNLKALGVPTIPEEEAGVERKLISA